jgi:hypothetical protein
MAPWLVLVHIEIEAEDQTTRVKTQLPRYYYHLRNTYDLPVLPIVIYLKVGLDASAWTPIASASGNSKWTFFNTCMSVCRA